MEWLLSLQTLVVISSNGVLTSADLSSKQVVLVRKIMDKIWLQPYLAIEGLTSSLYKYLSTSPMPYIHQQVLGWSSCHASYHHTMHCNALQCTVFLPKMHKVKLKVEYAAVLCVDNNTYLSSYIRTMAPVLGQASQLTSPDSSVFLPAIPPHKWPLPHTNMSAWSNPPPHKCSYIMYETIILCRCQWHVCIQLLLNNNYLLRAS